MTGDAVPMDAGERLEVEFERREMWAREDEEQETES